MKMANAIIHYEKQYCTKKPRSFDQKMIKSASEVEYGGGRSFIKSAGHWADFKNYGLYIHFQLKNTER